PPGGGVRVVLHEDRQGQGALEIGFQVEVTPGEVGCEEHDGSGLVDVARRAHADRLDLVPGAQLGDELLDCGLDRGYVGRRRLDLELLQDGAFLVDDSPGDLGAADVDAAGQAHDSSSGQASSPPSRSMCSTCLSPVSGRVAIIPETASINDDAALVR